MDTTTAETKIQRKIDEQEEAVAQKLESVSISPATTPDTLLAAREFYWDGAGFRNCGIATRPTDQITPFPLVPQLLLTPRLIADVLPVPPDVFSVTYGVTEEQFLQLTQDGLLVPNMYYFYRQGWKEYLKYPKLWPILLENPTRINALWITRFLEARFGFDSVQSQCQNQLEAQIAVCSGSELAEVQAATDGRVDATAGDKVARAIASSYAQRLAYLDVFSRNNEAMVTAKEKIWDLLRTPGRRADGLRLLNAAKALVASPVTAAYGGRHHLTDSDYQGIQTHFPEQWPLTPGQQSQIPSEVVNHIRFGLHIIQELSGVNLLRVGAASREPPQREPLEESEFKEICDVLKKPTIREARLATFAENVRDNLIDRGVVTPSVQDYLEVRNEIEACLVTLPRVAKALDLVSSMSWGAGEYQRQTPPTELTYPMMFLFSEFSGFTSMLATRMREREHVALLRWGPSRHLCGEYLKIKRELKTP